MPLIAAILDDIEPAELEFKFGNGSVALDLVATVGERWRRCFDRLRTSDDLARWYVEAGVLERPADLSAHDLDDARGLRSAIFDCVEARMGGREPPARAMGRLNRFAVLAAPAPQLTRGWGVRPVAADPSEAAPAAVARDAVALLAQVEPSRLRECVADDCSRLFVDRSRPGTRRWCESSGCGNKAKTASYRRRRRSTGS